jgi:hypothetical protein
MYLKYRNRRAGRLAPRNPSSRPSRSETIRQIEAADMLILHLLAPYRMLLVIGKLRLLSSTNTHFHLAMSSFVCGGRGTMTMLPVYRASSTVRYNEKPTYLYVNVNVKLIARTADNSTYHSSGQRESPHQHRKCMIALLLQGSLVLDGQLSPISPVTIAGEHGTI